MQWFDGIPHVVLSEGRVTWRCPMPGCGGDMHYNGMDWLTYPAGHHHACSRCSYEAAIKGAIFGDPNPQDG